MRVAILSDIHGNSIALDGVLADIEARWAENPGLLDFFKQHYPCAGPERQTTSRTRWRS